MKFLFITKASGPDYMADMVFHGGKSLFGINFYESANLWYMYDDLQDKSSLYGRGFTIYGKVNKNLRVSLPGPVQNLIQDHYFDKIIYGSIWRCSDYFDLVSKIYKKEDILVIDGEDEVDRINYNFLNKSIYYKREYNAKIEGVYPINFSIPKELVVTSIKEKTKLISDIIPNSDKNYSFTDEQSYYSEYQNSWYAVTTKKAGWDCLRHYEILMNGCIPLFLEIDNCPENTMTKFPKNLIKNLNKNNYNPTVSDVQELLNYTCNFLTTEKLMESIL